ncbi:MAG TPA: hypothetical protein PLV42_11340 [bacterium]|nr:hypothetical protein [bacterium]
MRPLLLCIACAFALFSASLSASPTQELLGSAEGTNPFSGRILPQGPETAYFNPALLLDVKDSFTLSFSYLYQGLRIGLFDRPAGTSILGDMDANGGFGSGIYAAQVVRDGLPDRQLPFKAQPTDKLAGWGSDSPEAHSYFATVGVVTSLIDQWLSLGITMILPVDELQGQSSFFVDEREANFSNSLHFELYEDRLQGFSISLGLGGRVYWEWLTAGIGLSLINSTQITASTYIPDAARNEKDILARSTIGLRVMPHFAIAARPWEKLRIAATVHLPSHNAIDSDIDMNFWRMQGAMERSVGESSFSIIHAYSPLNLSLAFALGRFDFDGLGLTATLTGSYERWSAYVNRQNARPQDNYYWDYELETVYDEGTENEATIYGGFVKETIEDLAWSDIFKVSAGAAMDYGLNRWGLDVAFTPTPVPAQTGRTNYVDNHRLSFGAGYSRTWEAGDYSFDTGIGAQLHYLVERTQKKTAGVAATATAPASGTGKEGKVVDEFPESVSDFDGSHLAESDGFQTNNPGYPGYKSDGVLISAGVWFTFYFDKKEEDTKDKDTENKE